VSAAEHALRGYRAFARSVTLAGAFTLIATSEAIPQETCRRTSLARPGWAALQVGRTSASATVVGGQFGGRFANGVGVSADVEVARYSDPEAASFNQGSSDLWSFRIGGAYFLELKRVPPSVAICPVASIEHERLGDLRILSIPAGLAFSREVALSSAEWHVAPQLEPRVALQHASVRGFTSTRLLFTVRGSAMFRSGDVFAGPLIDWTPSGRPRWMARVRFGGSAF